MAVDADRLVQIASNTFNHRQREVGCLFGNTLPFVGMLFDLADKDGAIRSFFAISSRSMIFYAALSVSSSANSSYQ